jgi:magnesium-protoporphyrin O-methyltransferase
MPTSSYQDRRGEVTTYFDRTAADAWSRLTSDAPVSRVRATVRAGRDLMRSTLLDWLPADLSGRRLLDAGCGTGALAVEAARRGADVVAIDVAPTLISLAQERAPKDLGNGSVRFLVGDMRDAALGTFDHVVAMDSLIHYHCQDVVSLLSAVAERTSASILFTYAPRTPALALMHTVGKLFPRGDRSPAIEPVATAILHRLIGLEPDLADWRIRRTLRVSRGFYTSQALELVRQ